jgi:hypothetical protein
LSPGLPDLAEVGEALRQRHRRHLRPGERFRVDHALEGEWEWLAFDLVRGGEVFRFQARLRPAEVRPRGASTERLVDFLDGVVGEWLEGGRETWPTLDYTDHAWRGVHVGLRGGVSRPDLEAEADRILAAAGGLPDDG